MNKIEAVINAMNRRVEETIRQLAKVCRVLNNLNPVGTCNSQLNIIQPEGSRSQAFWRNKMKGTKIIQTAGGPAEDADKIAPGITFGATASHGGYFLSPETNAQFPWRFRKRTLCMQGFKSWYEEDCESQIVQSFLPERFIAPKRSLGCNAGTTVRGAQLNH